MSRMKDVTMWLLHFLFFVHLSYDMSKNWGQQVCFVFKDLSLKNNNSAYFKVELNKIETMTMYCSIEKQ